MDGVLLATECTSKKVTQNAFYSGYQCDTMINNVFNYGPDGKVFITAINFPGSWVDRSVSVRFYNPSKKESVHIKYVSIKDSLAVGMRGTYWSDQCMNRVQGSCTQEYEILCCT